MMQSAIAQAAGRPYPVFNPIFEGFSNERLYDALCAATAPLDAGLEELQRSLRPIILNASKGFLNALSWTFDNAMGEALILIWELVRKRSYKGQVPFHRYFSGAWANRLNSLFVKTTMKNPVPMGDIQTGWFHDQPVFVSGWGFHPKGEEYRKLQAARNSARYDRKLAEQGKSRQVKKPPLTAEEKQERNRIKAAERFARLTPEEKRAKYDRDNERRRAARAAETPEQKAERRARYAGYARARAERNAQK